MLNSQERKHNRMYSGLADTLTGRQYNLVIGGCLVYGFFLNAIIIILFGNFFLYMNPIALLIGYFVCCLAGIFLTVSNSPAVSFLGYNLVVLPIGALLSVFLPAYTGMDVLMAIIATGLVVLAMTGLSAAYPHVFARMGRTLFIALLLGFLVEIVAVFLFSYAGNIFNWFFVILFSLYIGYDWCKAQSYPKTLDNAIDSACDLYLDIVNLFIRLLEIFGSRD